MLGRGSLWVLGGESWVLGGLWVLGGWGWGLRSLWGGLGSL